ncbi:MAG: polysaccharide biosynthesis protein [Acidobacteriota bacterium]
MGEGITRRFKSKRFLAAVLLVNLSLIAAFTARFLVFSFLGRIQSEASHWVFVDLSIRAYLNSLLPILVIGAAVYWARLHWGHRLKADCAVIDAVALCSFFGAMILLSVPIGSRRTFPQETWVLAWVLSLLAFAAITITRRLTEETRQKIFYHRAYHLLIDAVVVILAYWLALLLRFDGIPPPEIYKHQFKVLLPYMVILYVGMNLVWGVYSCIWRFTGFREAVLLAMSVSSAALVAVLVRILLLEDDPSVRVPFGVLLGQPLLAFVGFLSLRTLRRVQYNHKLLSRDTPERRGQKRILLVGAGHAGLMLVSEFRHRRDLKPVGFLDDDPQKRGRTIGGVRVLGTTHDVEEVVRSRRIDEVVLSMPTAPTSTLRRVVCECQKLQVMTSTVPSLSEIVLGKVKLGQLRRIRMEDLLGRAAVECNTKDEALTSCYRDRRVLVTGAGGSIGSELARQLRSFRPSELILLDKDESSLFEIALELRDDYKGPVTEVVADIRNLGRMGRVFSKHKPEVIFHAAAYKHVPMMEIYPAEAILNNVFGTRNLVQLSQLCGVESFVLISTDKAVNPTNIMGASKRVAEILVQKAAQENGVRFCGVRFGNVLGSRASVVPIFQKRIAEGKNLQITHPEIRRYFMTIPEAVQLVIQAGSLGKNGEIFVLDMGDPVKIVDLAHELIEQSGLVLGQDIEIEFTGLRPGEKLFEELLVSEENGARDTKYPKIFIASAVPRNFEQLDESLERLQKAAVDEDVEGIRRILRGMNIGYQPKVQQMPASVPAAAR